MAQKTLHNLVSPGEVVEAGGWAGIFGNHHPLNLEIGVGGGEFLLGLARRSPEENFVGLDIAGQFLRKAARKAEREGLTNVRFMVREAKLTLLELFDAESLQAVYVNFPDPWPKASHEKRRLFDARFTGLLEEKLVPEGYLYLGTDVEEYADEAYRALSASSILQNGYDRRWLNDRGWTGLETRYERKWREMGKELFYLAFRKCRTADTDRFSVDWADVTPVSLGRISPAEAAAAMKETVSLDDAHLMKPLAVRVEGNRVRVKLLLINRELGFRDYLHGMLAEYDGETRFELEDIRSVVMTPRKKALLQRYLDDVSRF